MLQKFLEYFAKYQRAKAQRDAIIRNASWFDKGLYYVMLIGPLLVLVWMLSAYAPASARPVPPETPTVSTEDFEHTRYCMNAETEAYQYPTDEARVVEHLQTGQIVSLTFYTTDGWMQVEYAGGSGYVPRKFVAECAQ